MRRRAAGLLPRCAGAVLLAASCAPAQAAEGYLTLASSHAWRGVLLRDHPTLLLGVEQSFRQRWAVGGWAAGVDQAWPFGPAEGGVLAGAYLARDGSCGTRCAVRGSVSRYLYPGSRAHGWSELALSARWHERIGASLAIARADGSGRRSRTLEAFLEQPLGQRWTLSLLLGHTRYAGFGYQHAALELRRPLGSWQLSLGTQQGRVLPPDGSTRHRGRLFVALSRGFGR
jgi:hypothetical protein